MTKKHLSTLAPAVALFIVAPVPAYAYLDPAAGSILLQIVLGGVAGGAVILKLFWGRIRSFFGGRSTSEPRDDRPSV